MHNDVHIWTADNEGEHLFSVIYRVWATDPFTGGCVLLSTEAVRGLTTEWF